MKIIYCADQLIYGKFQKFILLVQKLTNLTCFQIAKFFAKIAFIALTLDYILNLFSGEDKFSLVFDSVFWLCCIWIFWKVSRACEVLDEKYVNNYGFVDNLITNSRFRVERLVLSFFAIVPTIIFAILVFQSVVIWYYLPFQVGLIASWFCAYSIVCTPLPLSQNEEARFN